MLCYSSGTGWKTLEPACALDLLSRTQQGEFWVNKEEFVKEFDEITVGYPIIDGHLQSIYTGTDITDLALKIIVYVLFSTVNVLKCNS